jgi:hypothetical protein
MGRSDLSSTVIQGATRELRSLALASLARALGAGDEMPRQMPNLAILMMPENPVRPRVDRRARAVNGSMPFALFKPQSPLQRRVLASGKPPGLLERLLARFRDEPAQGPPRWAEATVATALSAPAFLAEAQRMAYRGLRDRVFFAPGGPPAQPLSVATFLTLIIRSGRPPGFSPQAWARLEALARQATDRPDPVGPMDSLILAEARKTFARPATDPTEG